MHFQLQNLNNEEIKEKCDDFIASNNDSSFFHTVNYYKALSLTKGFKPLGLLLLDDEGSILALAIGESTNESSFLPWVSKRVIFYAPPLYKKIEHLNYFLIHLKNLNVGLFLQIRTFREFTIEELNCYKKNGYQFSDHLNAYIILKGKTADDLFSSFSKDRRKGIRRASERYSLQAVELDSINKSVDLFYDMQKKLYMKKRHPMKPKEFFLNLVEQSESHVKLVFAFYEGEPIATQLFISYKDKMTALYTATMEEHKDKYAGEFLIWHLLKRSLNENCILFDFGGGGNPNEEYGPRLYKERFGTIFQNVGRFNLPKSNFYKFVMFVYKLLLKS